jgi:hypothetical protein
MIKTMVGNGLDPCKILKKITAAFFIAIAVLGIAAANRSEPPPELKPSDTVLRKKIEAYKKFKERWENKNFQLDSYPVRRVEHNHGKSNTSLFNIYRITYGNIADNIKEYDKSRKQIVQNPTNSHAIEASDCHSRRYVEEYTGKGQFLTCLEDAKLSYPISLIFNTLAEEELKDIAIIYEFDDGDLDMQFSLDKGSDKKFIQSLFRKLQRADEQNDAKRKEASMAPILPSRNQRITSSFIDEDKDGELDFALIPYCIDGSYFDDDPYNNTIQIALKYKLVTQKDLQGRTLSERIALEKRMGLWMWDKPSAILTSFNDHPGPDIVFYDLGTVVDNRIVDPKPDGEFDEFEFLY